MKHWTLFFAAAILLLSFCAKKEVPPPVQQDVNPFFSAWTTPFETPPFDRIKEAHYLPAFKEWMAQQLKEIDAIISTAEPPSFANTVEELERSGALLIKVNNVFSNLTAANTNDELQKIQKEVAPLRAKHRDDIGLNPKLFQRIKAVYEQKAKLNLMPEQDRLLEKTYKDFVRGGANLDDAKKAEFRKINEELAVLTQKFSEDVLK
jgi:peptidyl-dipeptidase Dcp